MGLQATVTSAVLKAKNALGDLAIDLVLKTRTANDYTPGSPITYTEVSKDVKGVITKYRADEIDGQMIKTEDVVLILFPPEDGSSVFAQQNDVVVNGSVSWRVLNNNPIYAGSAIAFSLVQGRPV